MIKSPLPQSVEHRVQLKFLQLHSFLFTALKHLNNNMGLEELSRKCTPPLLLRNHKQFQNTLSITCKTCFLPTLTIVFSLCLLSRNAALDFIMRIKDILLDAVSPVTAMEIQIDVKMVLENAL